MKKCRIGKLVNISRCENYEAETLVVRIVPE
jgi:hypothetical protein